MRHTSLIALLGSAILGVSACGEPQEAQVARAIESVQAIDQANMIELMLNVADPAEAVTYFQRQLEQDPGSIELRRGLATALAQAGRPAQAVPVWQEVIQSSGSTNEDRVQLADAQIRDNKWAEAGATLNSIPPTYETYRRYRLEAMIADSRQEWNRADHFYETAAGLTTRPSGVYNNWGYSKLTRGEFRDAERLFIEALQYDPTSFTAKNNLVLARAGQRRYELPLVDMTQTERAQFLHTMAIAAIRQGDVNVGRTMLEEAIDTHPRHFDQAVRALRALDGNVGRG